MDKDSQDGSGSVGTLPSQLEKPCMVALDRLATHLQWKTPDGTHSPASFTGSSVTTQAKTGNDDENSAPELGVQNPTYSEVCLYAFLNIDMSSNHFYYYYL